MKVLRVPAEWTESRKQLASPELDFGTTLVWVSAHPTPDSTTTGRACRLRADLKITPPSRATTAPNTRAPEIKRVQSRERRAAHATAYLSLFTVLKINISCRTSNFFSVYKHWQETPPEVLPGESPDWSYAKTRDRSGVTQICGHNCKVCCRSFV